MEPAQRLLPLKTDNFIKSLVFKRESLNQQLLLMVQRILLIFAYYVLNLATKTGLRQVLG